MGVLTQVSVVPPPRRHVAAFARWVAEATDPGAAVLDVGAGAHLSGALRPLLRKGPWLVGVDPDVAIEGNADLSEWHRLPLEAFAENHGGRFDVVFSVYVLEHVADPDAFVDACAHVLRPGGSWFGLTLNTRQYFGAATWAMSRLHGADWLLHRLKGDALDHEHHFPTAYRLNSVPVLRRQCERSGFASLEVRCYDATERYQWYLPSSLHWFPPLYTRLAYALDRPELMGHLTFRAIKAGG